MFPSPIPVRPLLVLVALAGRAPLARALQIGDCASVPPVSCGPGFTTLPPIVATACYGCPLGAQLADWSSESPTAPVPRLTIPKYHPPASGCNQLAQVDVEITGSFTGTLRIENQNGISSCFASWNSGVSQGVGLVNNPGWSSVSLQPAQSGSVSLGVFDGVLDFNGPSGETLAFGPTSQTVCRRFVGADAQFFLDTTPSTSDDTVSFSHSSSSQNSVSGSCFSFVSLFDVRATIEVRVTYKVCSSTAPCGQTGPCASVPPASCGPGTTTLHPNATTACYGCPLGTQVATWNSEAPVGPAPRLSIAKYQPTPGLCQQLVQVDVEVVSSLTGSLQAENLTPFPCSTVAQVGVFQQVDLVGSPGLFPLLHLAAVHGWLLGPFDGGVDYAGPSGVTQALGTIQQTACRRFTGADAQRFLDTTPSPADDTVSFSHFSTDATSISSCGSMVFLNNIRASIEVRVTYTVCSTNLSCAPAFASFCWGASAVDHATPCPCGNGAAPGNGCANSVNPAGANLTATGSAAADDVRLWGSGMPATVSAIYLQGDGLADAVFGDGVRCAGGTLLRLRSKVNVGGVSSFPDGTDTQTLSERGGVTPGSGARRYYQTYYRNSAPAFCPPETFNVTNGWLIDW